MTSALTGFPGSPNTSRGLNWSLLIVIGGGEAVAKEAVAEEAVAEEAVAEEAVAEEAVAASLGTIATVSGFPGFIRTESTRTWPRRRSSGGSMSRSPAETPPEQMSTSAVASARSRAASSASSVSVAMPKSMGPVDSAAERTRRPARLAS